MKRLGGILIGLACLVASTFSFCAALGVRPTELPSVAIATIVSLTIVVGIVAWSRSGRAAIVLSAVSSIAAPLSWGTESSWSTLAPLLCVAATLGVLFFRWRLLVTALLVALLILVYVQLRFAVIGVFAVFVIAVVADALTERINPYVRRPLSYLRELALPLSGFATVYLLVTGVFAIAYRMADIWLEGGAFAFYPYEVTRVESIGDYLYLSLIVMGANQPTDAIAISSTAKSLIGLQSVIGLAIVVIYLQWVVQYAKVLAREQGGD